MTAALLLLISNWWSATVCSEQPSTSVDFQSLDKIFHRLDEDLQADPRYHFDGDNRALVRDQAAEIERRATAGDRIAQFQMGAMSLVGLEIRPNAGKAWSWFSQAGGQEHPLALLAYGQFRLQVLATGVRDRQADYHVYEALGKIGAAASEAIPFLERQLVQDEWATYQAARALALIGGHGTEILIAELSSKDVSRRRAAAAAFSEAWPNVGPAVPQLTKALEDEDQRVRESARRAIKGLEAHLARQQRIAEGKSEYPIPEPGPKNERTAAEVRQLIEALADPAPKIRAETAVKLRELREQACSAVPALVVALRDPDTGVRARAAQAIHFIGPGGVEVDPVPQLILALDDSEAEVRREAAGALDRAWPNVQRAIPKLIECLGDTVGNGHGSSASASYALKDMARRGNSEIVVAALRAELQRTKGGPYGAISALRGIGPAARAALPELQPLLKHSDEQLRNAAAMAIGQIGGPPNDAVAAMVNELRNDDWVRRERAARSLGGMGPVAAAAVPELIGLLENPARQAYEAFEAAAELGAPDAQFELGRLLLDGLGTTPASRADPVAAAKWFDKAAEQGHAEAQRHLGILYRQGRGVKRSDVVAEEWYRKSTELRIVERLSRPRVAQENYDSALAVHANDQWNPKVPDGTLRRRLLTITYLSQGGRRTRHFHLLSDGAVFTSDEFRHEFMVKGGIPTQYGKLDSVTRKHVDALSKDLPQGVEFAPVLQQYLVSRNVMGKWSTDIYDAAALPRKLLLLLHQFGAINHSIEPDPRLTPVSHFTDVARLHDVTFQADGTLLLCGEARRIRAWRDDRPVDVEAVKLEFLPGFPVAVSRDAARIVIRDGQRLALFDARAEKIIAALDENAYGFSDDHVALFSDDDRVLAAFKSRAGILEIRDATTGALSGSIPEVTGLIAVSPSGDLVAAADRERSIIVWDTKTLKKRHAFAVNSRQLAFSPDGKHAAVLTPYGMTFCDLVTGDQRIQTALSVGAGPIRYAPGGNLLVYKRDRNDFVVLDVATGFALGIGGPHGRFDIYGDPWQGIVDLEFSPDGRSVVSALADGALKVWSLAEICRQD